MKVSFTILPPYSNSQPSPPGRKIPSQLTPRNFKKSAVVPFEGTILATQPTLEILAQQSQLAVDAAAPEIARQVTTHGLSEVARVWMENATYDAASRENQTLKYIRADNEVYTRKENKRIEEAKVMLGLFKMKGLMQSETFKKKLSAFEAKPEFFHNTDKGDFYGHMEYQVRGVAADYVGF